MIKMPSWRYFTVKPRLPAALEPLYELAADFYWPLFHETFDLFRLLDPELWEQCEHNPVAFLHRLGGEKMREAAASKAYVDKLEEVYRAYREYIEGHSFPSEGRELPFCRQCIAYFSAEFGIAESLPMYAGGLGVLAGDLMKSASDLGLPLVGVSLLYRHGYFRQRINVFGRQEEIHPYYDFYSLPLEQVRREDGMPLTVAVEMPERQVHVLIWRARVGRLSLFLLDTDSPLNLEIDRGITDRLYRGADIERRLQQEMILGIGGVRALYAMGIEPVAYHLNEGHSAFLVLEHIRQLMQKYRLDFAAARELAASAHIFTTHTPVPAGIDLFPHYLIDKYFTAYYQEMGLTRQEFFALGRKDPHNQHEPFNMAVLALRLSSWANAVSRLHARTARRMWQDVWPEVPEEELPIEAITNGVHLPTWTGPEMAGLFDRYLGQVWRERPQEKATWERVREIPPREIWQAHQAQKDRLVEFVRKRLAASLRERGASERDVREAAEVLDPAALTVGFARRFAAYKRPALIFQDVERLAAICRNSRYPVQFIFAGKAHRRDEEGKKLIEKIVEFTGREEFKGRVIFLEDYDMNVARHILQGVDLWLANPRRPMEACSTSGMKAVINGALHVSTLDGWWDEAWTPEAGWAIGRGEEYADQSYQDEVEARLLYDLLEKEIIPLYYRRDSWGLPLEWVEMMKRAIVAFAPVFNSHRMVLEYYEKFYRPAAAFYEKLKEGGQKEARELAAWKKWVEENWGQVRIEKVETGEPWSLREGDSLTVEAVVFLGTLRPEDVQAMVYCGPAGARGEILRGEKVVMDPVQDLGEGRYLFRGSLPFRYSGRYGYAVWLVPYRKSLARLLYGHLALWG